MHWVLLLGGALGTIQLLLLPFLKVITLIKESQQVAKYPSYIACLAPLVNGLAFAGEGIIMG